MMIMMRRHPGVRGRQALQTRGTATKFGKAKEEAPQQQQQQQEQQKQVVTLPSELPVYLKPSRSGRRKASFVFTRMRDEPPEYAFKAPSLGTALPLFCITSSSCEYYALRLPLIKAGFKRLPDQASIAIPSNVIWGHSMSLHHNINILSSSSSLRQSHGLMNSGVDHLGFQLQANSERAQEGHLSALKMVCNHQRFNHFPHSHRNIGCKYGLTRRLRRVTESLEVEGEKQRLFNFVPRTWIYPEEKEALMKALAAAPSTQRFIWKPARGSCGHGIFICVGGIKNAPQWERVAEAIENRALHGAQHSVMSHKYVVQEYIEDPLLLDGRKTDLRLYVTVTSYDPLVVYLHSEGLVRLAAQEYGTGGDRNRAIVHFDPFRDLTNYSVGQKWSMRKRQRQQPARELDNVHVEPRAASAAATTVVAHDAGDDVGLQSPPLELKKSLAELWDHIDRMHSLPMHAIPSMTFANAPLQRRMSARVWDDIARVIVKTLLTVKEPLASAMGNIPLPGGFFELYGFDIMLDAKLKPWLVEVNTLPSLASTSLLDYTVKTNVVADLLNLAMIEPFERPAACLEGVEKGDVELRHAGLFDSLTRVSADAVHRWNPRSSRDVPQLDDCEAKEELRLRLQDEFAYSRGFQRIFPPLPAAQSSRLMDEVTILAPHIPLSKSDVWALET